MNLPGPELTERLREFYVARADCRDASDIITGLLTGNRIMTYNGIPISLRSWYLLVAPISTLMGRI